MRRKDREMDREFALKIIDKSAFGTIALVDEEGPYCLPLSIVREGEFLYFHSAREGRKIEILDREPRVSVAFVGQVKVPKLHTEDELDRIVEEGRIGEIISKVYTSEFESAIVFGKVKRILDDSQKIKGLRLICEKYTADKLKYFDKAIEKSLNLVNIYRIEIEKISGKRKKFDEDKKEMKWMRME